MRRKTLKGWLTLPSLILVMAVGTFANGGITVNENPITNSCTNGAKEGITVNEGSIIDAISDLIKGFLITDAKSGQPCVEKNGITVNE